MAITKLSALGLKTGVGGKVLQVVTATDGTQNALGALIAEVDATSGNTKAVIVTRDAILADHAVIWPSAITLEQKTAAIKQLEARGVIIRKGV